MLPQTIIVREKTKRERHQEGVTRTIILGSLLSVVGFTGLLVLLIKLLVV